MKRLIGFCFLTLISLSASAQSPTVGGPFSAWPPHFNPYLPFPYPGESVVSTAGTSAGVTAGRTGSATVTLPSGVRVPVPVSASANIPKAAIATAARSAVRLLGPIGAAATAYQIYQEVQDSGITVCPPPDFFCKPASGAASANTGGFEYKWTDGYNATERGDPLAMCRARYPAGGSYPYPSNVYVRPSDPNIMDCWKMATPSTGTAVASLSRQSTCQTGYTLTGGSCTNNGAPVPFTDAEFDAELQAKMSDPLVTERIYRGLSKDFVERPISGVTQSTIVPTSTPVTVTAPPVTTSPTVTGSRTYPNGDGSTSTETKTEQTTVTPQVTGSTASDIGVKYQPVTTTTISTVNNTTNVTNIETVVSTPPVASTAAPDLPTDYNREATQLEIRDELKGVGAPAPPPDQAALAETKIAETDSNLATKFEALPGESTTDKANWFSWVWTPPIGVCAPFAGTVGTYAISWDLCPTISNIRECLGFIFALFGALQIYSLVFRGS